MIKENQEFAKSRIEYLLKVDNCLNKHDREALEIAIQALSQEPTYYPPCQDCNKKMDEIRRIYDKIKEQEPCEDIAQERYKDLCEYFGGAKDILKSREDFKAWLERVKWHIHKAEELYEKYEYKKEPCNDAISREAVCKMIYAEFVNPQDGMQEWRNAVNDVVENILYKVEQLPSVTHKSKTGHWIVDIKDMDYCFCSECKHRFDVDHLKFSWDKYEFPPHCPNCGAKMVEPQESEV